MLTSDVSKKAKAKSRSFETIPISINGFCLFLAKVDPDVWGSLKANLIKFVSMKDGQADKVVKQVKAKFGETPAPNEIKAFMV